MKKCLVTLAVLAVVGVGCLGQLSAFNRTAFVAEIREVFAPLESFLAEGDKFDYEGVLIFSGIVNGWGEHVITLPLTEDSPSYELSKRMGSDLLWSDVTNVPLGGFYIMDTTNCIHDLVPGTPYVIRGVSWERAEVLDQYGNLARYFETKWTRGIEVDAWYAYTGNSVFHFPVCVVISTNQGLHGFGGPMEE
ncbi:hypothetical protein ACFLSZ_05190 [Candidatus Bipolaricaulota bacterium]